ncbi:hypothetical protein ACU5AY_05980 [Rhizobium sp. PAMB 3174]
MDDADLRLYLRDYRRRLSKGRFNSAASPLARLAIRRNAESKSRALLKKGKKGKRLPIPKRLLLTHRYSENKIILGLRPDRKSLWVPITQRRHAAKYSELVLNDFTFIDHPDETLTQLVSIIKFECFAVDAFLHFDDKYCIDIASYLVLAEMWPQLAKVFKGGRMSTAIQKVLDSVQLSRDLGMRLNWGHSTDNVWAFPRRTRRPAGSSRSAKRELEPQRREHVADEFCDAVDEWLEEAAFEIELSRGGKARLANIILELLDNAERHSNPPGSDGTWSTAAFMAKRPESGVDVYRCYMGFLSVGSTIAEGLKTAQPAIRQQIEEYCDLHEGTGRSRETLATLVALQDGVTRDPVAATNQRGGIGLQEVLDLINVLGFNSMPGKAPKMTIVSGRSCIMARQPYVQGTRNGVNEPRRLWFNEENSPRIAPDPEFVYDLNTTFPGTIIGLTFVLSGDDLKRVLNETDPTERVD